MAHPLSHIAVGADSRPLRPPNIYHGGILVATSGGAATVTVYDGNDTGGTLIDRYSVAASQHEIHALETGIALRVGLYVDIGSNVSSFTINYRERG